MFTIVVFIQLLVEIAMVFFSFRYERKLLKAGGLTGNKSIEHFVLESESQISAKESSMKDSNTKLSLKELKSKVTSMQTSESKRLKKKEMQESVQRSKIWNHVTTFVKKSKKIYIVEDDVHEANFSEESFVRPSIFSASSFLAEDETSHMKSRSMKFTDDNSINSATSSTFDSKFIKEFMTKGSQFYYIMRDICNLSLCLSLAFYTTGFSAVARDSAFPKFWNGMMLSCIIGTWSFDTLLKVVFVL
jgi:hypothetical protein